MSGFGRKRAEVMSHYIGQNSNGNAFVGVKFVVEDWDDVLTSKIYLTKAAMPMARAKLKAIGFDVDQRDLDELETNPELLMTSKTLVDVSEEVYNEKTFIKCEIVTDFAKPDKEKLSALTEALRKAKDGDDGKPKAAPSKGARRPAPSRPAKPEDLAEAPAAEEPLVTPDNDPPAATAFPASLPEDADIPF